MTTTFLQWSDDLLTNIPIVDEQHLKLVGMINEAASIVFHRAPKQFDEVERRLSELLEFSEFHFRTEEELMLAQGVDVRTLEHHKKTHADLAQQALETVNKFKAGTDVSGKQLMGFFATWLLFHTMGEDMNMARQIKAVQAGNPPPMAYETAGGSRYSPDYDVLTRTFVRLYSQMSEQISALDLHTLELERRVQERTEELEDLSENLRLSRDAAEAGNQAKNRFLGMVSHELRTPMNAIVGFAELLCAEEVSPPQKDLARRIVVAAGQLLDLLNGIIEYSRDSEGKPESFVLNSLVTNACQESFQAARKKGLVAKLEVATALPTSLRGEVKRIALILKQLTANAVKFTPQGSVMVRVEFRGKTENGGLQVRFSVEDTGIGIPQEKLQHLFDAFHQLDDSPTRVHGGVGLGLALTRQAARMMGGEIGVKSEPGKGSLFWLDLLLAPGELTDVDAVLAHAAPLPNIQTEELVEEAGKPNPEKLKQALIQLEKLLVEADTRASNVFEEISPFLQRALGQRFNQLATCIAEFEYDLALKTLQEIKKNGTVNK